MTVMIGKAVPTPISAVFTEVLERVEITEDAFGRSGFQLVFGAGRGDPPILPDYPLLGRRMLRPFNRVVVVVTFNATPHVLADGFITRLDLAPGTGADAALTATGEDVSIMMDLKAKIAEHPGQSEMTIANKLILSYAQYGLVPKVIPPPVVAPPLPIRRVPVQHGTDLWYLNDMASRFGYVFSVKPGPVPLTNQAYWGPPRMAGVPQRALSVAMGAQTNVVALSFANEALAPATVSGRIQDSENNRVRPIRTTASTLPPLSREPAIRANRPHVRERLLQGAEGLTFTQARALAQGETNLSTTSAVVGRGELDALVYGGILRAGAVVGVRGAGTSYDGNYAVKRVTHLLRRGELRQRFMLMREGVGALSPVVRP
jgi:hypothetical protein